jgi:hypothetical protein
VTLELHVDLFIDGHPISLTGEGVRAAARRLDGWGGRAWVPHTSHQVLHLAVHFAWSHMMGFGTWRTLRDLDAMTRASSVDWRHVVQLSRRYKMETCCYWTFRLAQQLSGVGVPAEVLEELRPPQSEFVLRRLERHLSLNIFPVESLCPSEAVRRGMWSLAVLPWRSGHGPVRPWWLDEQSAPTPQPKRAGLSRLAKQLSSLGAWGRYLRTMVTAR